MAQRGVRRARTAQTRVTLSAVQEIDDEFDLKHVQTLQKSDPTGRVGAKATTDPLVDLENVENAPPGLKQGRSEGRLKKQGYLSESVGSKINLHGASRQRRKGLSVRSANIENAANLSDFSDVSDSDEQNTKVLGRSDRGFVSSQSSASSLPSLYTLARRTKSAAKKKRQKGRHWEDSETSASEQEETAKTSSKAEPKRGILRRTSRGLPDSGQTNSTDSGKGAVLKEPRGPKRKGVRFEVEDKYNDDENMGSQPRQDEMSQEMENRHKRQVQEIIVNRHNRLQAAIDAATKARSQFAKTTRISSTEVGTQALRLGRPSVRTNFEDEMEIVAAKSAPADKQAKALQKARKKAIQKRKRESKRRIRRLMQRGSKKKRGGVGSDLSGASESDSEASDSVAAVSRLDGEFDSGLDSATETETDTETDTETETEIETDTDQLAEQVPTSEEEFLNEGSDIEDGLVGHTRMSTFRERKETQGRTSHSLFSPGFHSALPDSEWSRQLHNIEEHSSPETLNLSDAHTQRRISRSNRLSGQSKETKTTSDSGRYRVTPARLKPTEVKSVRSVSKRLFDAEIEGSEHDQVSLTDSESESALSARFPTHGALLDLGVSRKRSPRIQTMTKLNGVEAKDPEEEWSEMRKSSIRERLKGMVTPSRNEMRALGIVGTPATETASLLGSLSIDPRGEAVASRTQTPPSKRSSPGLVTTRGAARKALFKRPDSVIGPVRPLAQRGKTESRSLMEELRVSAGLRARTQRSRASILSSPSRTSPSRRRSMRLTGEVSVEQTEGINKHLLGLAGDFGLDTSYLRSLREHERENMDRSRSTSDDSFGSEDASNEGNTGELPRLKPLQSFTNILSSDSDMGEISDFAEDAEVIRSKTREDKDSPQRSGIQKSRLQRATKAKADAKAKSKSVKQSKDYMSEAKSESMPKLSDGLVIDDYQQYYDKIDHMDLDDIFIVD